MAGFCFSPELDPFENEEQNRLYEICKKLSFNQFDKTQPVQVYLRIRPAPDGQDTDSSCCYHQASDRTLTVVDPKKNGSCDEYLFSKIFGSCSSQRDVFTSSVIPAVEDFLQGKNCLLFTYGVTNSGKTHTIIGTPSDPGLLPRSIDVIFNSLPALEQLPFKSKCYSEIAVLNEEECEREMSVKANIFLQAYPPPPPPPAPLSIDESNSLIQPDDTLASVATKEACSFGVSMISELDVHEDHVIDVDTFEDELGFCLFVSYVEIYSEFIYDLLGDKPEGGRQRPCLKLAADKHGNQYIKGLREVQVHSAKEAFDLLRIGLCHRHIAETSLNHNSSRGHTLYTIKLVRMKKGLTKPSVARVNRITIVDLAGSERSSKTKAHGERIKEAGSINTSLLTLGRCIETLRSNQNKKMQYQRQIVPFRDSKLTMLLQSHFIERESLEGRIIMITNISSTSTVYNETSHVLKFSAITSKVVPQITVTQQDIKPTQHDGDMTQCKDCLLYKEQLEALKELSRRRIAELKVEMWENEAKLRQQLSNEYNRQIIEIEEQHNREIEEYEMTMKEDYKQRLEIVKSLKKQANTKKRRRVDDGDDERDESGYWMDKCRELEKEIERERNRSASEINDLIVTYDTRLTLMNKQNNTLSLKVKEMEKESEDLLKETERKNKELLTDVTNRADEENMKLKNANELLLEEIKCQSSNMKMMDIKMIELTELLKKTEDELKQARDHVRGLQEEMEEKERRLSEEIEGKDKENEEHLLHIIQLESSLGLLDHSNKHDIQHDYHHQMLTSELQDKENEISSLKESNEVKSSQFQREMDKLTSELQNEISSLKESNEVKSSQFQHEMDKLTSKLQEKENEILSLKESNEVKSSQFQHEMDKLTSELQNEISSLKESNEVKSSQFQHEMDKLTSKLQEKENEISSLKESNEVKSSQFQHEMDKLTSKLQEKENEISSLKESNEVKSSQFQHEMDKLTSELQNEISSLKESNEVKSSQFQHEMDKLTSKLQEKENEISSLKESNEVKSSQFQHEMDKLTSKLQEKENEISSLKESNEVKSSQFQHEMDKLTSELQNEISSLKESNEVKSSQFQHEMDKLTSKLQEKENEISSLKESNEVKSSQFQREMDKLTSELQNEISSLKESNEVKSSQFQHEMDKLTSKLQEKENDILLLKESNNLLADKLKTATDTLLKLQLSESVSSRDIDKSLRSNVYDEVAADEHLYDSVHLSNLGGVLNESQKDNIVTKGAGSHVDDTDNCHDDSGRHLDLLERSSQLVDSFDDDEEEEEEPTRVKIAYDMRKDAKKHKPPKERTNRFKALKDKLMIKKSESPIVISDSTPYTPAEQTGRRYNLRSKIKPLYNYDFSDENVTPLKKRTRTGTKKKKMPVMKNEISAPLYFEDHVTPEVPPLKVKSSRIRPAAKH